MSALAFSLTGTFGSDAVASSPEPASVSVDLVERIDSGVMGTAQFESFGGETRIEITIAGGAASYLPYLHRGSCEKYSDQNGIPLSIATLEAPGKTTVDLALERLATGEYVVDLHIAQGSLESLMDPATSVACGVIRAGESVDSLQPPVAGIGPADAGRANWIVAALISIAAIFGVTGVRVRRVARPVACVDSNEVALQRLRGMFT